MNCKWCEGLGYRTVSIENDQGSGDIVQEECEVCHSKQNTLTTEQEVERIVKEFEDKFNWKNCGNFEEVETDNIIRPCHKCGYGVQFCANCGFDHHVIKHEVAIKDWLITTLVTLIEDRNVRAREVVLEILKLIEEHTDVYWWFYEENIKDIALSHGIDLSSKK